MIPALHPTVRDVVEAIAVLCIVGVSLFKLWSLYKHTVQWNGLGRALRDEKWAYVFAWSWLLMKQYIPILDHWIFLIPLALIVIVTELRVAKYVPRVTIHHQH